MAPDSRRRLPKTARPEALIAVVAARHEGQEAAAFRGTWQQAVPGAEFTGIAFDAANSSDFADRLAEAARQRTLSPRRTILLGRGSAGRAALDLLLTGRIRAAGMLTIDIDVRPPLGPYPPSDAIVRMVQHQRSDDPGCALYFALVEEVRRTTSDVRYILLQHASATTAEATFRAGAGYLVELVAHASRLPQNPETSP